MNINDSKLIEDLLQINRKLSCLLWQAKDVNSKPDVFSPRLIFPIYQKGKNAGKIRTSEQEAKHLYTSLLNTTNYYYYSVETPTKEGYKQKGSKYMAALTDLTIYEYDQQRFNPKVNIELKANSSSSTDIGKDIEKIVKEGLTGNWFHILSNSDRGTIPALFKKFIMAFIEYPNRFSPESFSKKKISILFCFCVREKQQAYLRHFDYEPSDMPYEEYVNQFFNSEQMEKWDLFKRAANGCMSPAKHNELVNASPKNCPPADIMDQAVRLWKEEDNGFTSKKESKGHSLKHYGKPCLWVFPTYFEVAPHGKGNDSSDKLCIILRKYFSDIKGKSKVFYDSVDYSWNKFCDFLEEVKRYLH